MAESRLPSRAEDFSEWYNQLVLKAELADYAPVRGCMVVRPYGWTLWENITAALDSRFKATGHVNAAFPLLIPMSFLQKEKDHVEGFSPQLAVVTIGGGEQLEEPLVVRPTSETIIGHMYSKWIQSYRDLPVLINVWNSVVRWELRTKLFLRTTEFYWQEGHTAHATAEEAQAETEQMLNVYADFAENEAAVPVIKGRKSESEKFAGAVTSYSIEAMMGDTRALQSGTSHYLGDKFARAFSIQYLDRENTQQFCQTTSWGLSTRFVGAIIMVHGDDQGLVLPPRLAPHQAVLVPIYKNDQERSVVMEQVETTRQALEGNRIRLRIDDRQEVTPGFKFNDWEMRGVPVRIEIGPKDVSRGTVTLARRDQRSRQSVNQGSVAEAMDALLADIQRSMLERGREFQRQNTHQPEDYDGFKEAVQSGWAEVWWCGDPADETRIQQDTKATNRVILLDQKAGEGRCIVCGKAARERAIFARAY